MNQFEKSLEQFRGQLMNTIENMSIEELEKLAEFLETSPWAGLYPKEDTDTKE